MLPGGSCATGLGYNQSANNSKGVSVLNSKAEVFFAYEKQCDCKRVFKNLRDKTAIFTPMPNASFHKHGWAISASFSQLTNCWLHRNVAITAPLIFGLWA